MPRIYDEDRNPLDYCKKCFTAIEIDARQNEANEVDADHPDYEGTGYKCEVCKKLLATRDN